MEGPGRAHGRAARRGGQGHEGRGGDHERGHQALVAVADDLLVRHVVQVGAVENRNLL